MNARFENMQEQIIEAIDRVFDKQIARVDDIINKLKRKKVDDNYEIKMGVENSGETDKLDVNKDGQMTYNEVSRGENYDNISKNMVLENNGVNIESTDEVLECNNGMLVCVDESERKWRESIQVEGLQGVNFSRDVVAVSYTHLDVYKRQILCCMVIVCVEGGYYRG